MDWKETLRRRLSREPLTQRSDQERKEEEMELFTKYYLEWKGGRKNATASYRNIPRFYYRTRYALDSDPDVCRDHFAFFHQESFPSVVEGLQSGKFQSSGRAPRGPTWTDEETRVLLGHWHTLLVQNMPTNSDLYAVLAKKMAEEGFPRTRIQCNNRIRDLRKAYLRAKDAMGRAGAVPVRCRFFREMEEICGGEAESFSVSQAGRLQLQPGPSWEPPPEISWKVEEDSETDATVDGIGDTPQEPLQGLLKMKGESDLEGAAPFQLPVQPISLSSTSTVGTAPTSGEDSLPPLQEPDFLLLTRPTVVRLPKPLSPTHSAERLEVPFQKNTATGRSEWDPERVRRAPLIVDGVAQLRARRHRTREENVDLLLEEMRAGREAMDTTFRLFLDQQRLFQKSLLREMRLTRQEQRRAAEEELKSRQEEWRLQRTQHVQDLNRSDMEMSHLRRELSLLRRTFMDFFAAVSPLPSSSRQRTPSPLPSQKESADSSRFHWDTPTAAQRQTPLPDQQTLGVPSRGRRGRPRRGRTGGTPPRQET